MLVKIFAIQHDAGHGALFGDSPWNDRIGRLLCPLVMTPYKQWAQEHAEHHATSGNLERRGIGDVDLWTVAEFKAATPSARFWYRFYRHPLFLFGPGALGYFLIKQRFTWYRPDRWDSRLSVWYTNIAIVLWVAGMSAWLGTYEFLFVFLTSLQVASTLGTWIFYIGHQFPGSYWESPPDWSFFDASMKGASFYDVPSILHYSTCNIGFHHIHHLSSRIPFYNLPRANAEVPQFRVPRLTLSESLPYAWLALWDEDKKRMVRFDEVRA